MAEAFAIFGAVAGAIGTAKTALEWIEILRESLKDFEGIGDIVQQLYYDFVVAQIRFNSWAEEYGLNSSTTTLTLRQLWGRQGSESISLQLIRLNKLVDRFNSLIALLISDEVLDILDPNIRNRYATIGDRPMTLADKISKASAISKLVKKGMKLEEKLDFLEFGGKALSSDLDEIERRLEVLQRDAENFLQRKTKKEAADEPTTTSESDEIPELLRIAMANKGASSALYTSCFASSRANRMPKNPSLTSYIKLEMRLRNEFAIESILSDVQSVRFHILLARPQIARPLEILITGPIDWSTLEDDQRDFLDACEAVLNNAPCEFTAIFNSQPLRFRSCLPRDLIQADQQSFMPLSILFGELQRDRTNSFLLSEKVDLAYRIAEYGLLLLGTSWLSGLRCGNIQRHKVSRNRPRFLLEAKASTPETTKAVLEVAGEQIFWIGILLIEVAIGQSISDLREDHFGNLELQSTSFRHGLTPAWYPTSAILRQVQGISMRKYAETVDFCLKKRNGSPHWSTTEADGLASGNPSAQDILMKAYYNKVYQPLEVLRGLF